MDANRSKSFCMIFSELRHHGAAVVAASLLE